jgi:hypothetical protein
LVLRESLRVGSSHNRSTPAEDNEEALLLASPAIGRLTGEAENNRKEKERALYPRPEEGEKKSKKG